MPLVRLSLPQSLDDNQLAAVSEAIHGALVEIFSVPAADRFQAISRHSPAELVCTPAYLGIEHGGHVALLQITVTEGRSVALKQALYAAIAQAIDATGAIAAKDVIINLLEVKKENWSFGNGLAQYVTP